MISYPNPHIIDNIWQQSGYLGIYAEIWRVSLLISFLGPASSLLPYVEFSEPDLRWPRHYPSKVSRKLVLRRFLQRQQCRRDWDVGFHQGSKRKCNLCTFGRFFHSRLGFLILSSFRHFLVRQFHRRKLRFHNLLLRCAYYFSPSNCLLLLWHSTLLRGLIWDMYRLWSSESKLPPYKCCQ